MSAEDNGQMNNPLEPTVIVEIPVITKEESMNDPLEADVSTETKADAMTQVCKILGLNNRWTLKVKKEKLRKKKKKVYHHGLNLENDKVKACKSIFMSQMPTWFEYVHVKSFIQLMSDFDVDSDTYYIDMFKDDQNANMGECLLIFMENKDCVQLFKDLQGIHLEDRPIIVKLDLNNKIADTRINLNSDEKYLNFKVKCDQHNGNKRINVQDSRITNNIKIEIEMDSTDDIQSMKPVIKTEVVDYSPEFEVSVNKESGQEQNTETRNVKTYVYVKSEPPEEPNNSYNQNVEDEKTVIYDQNFLNCKIVHIQNLLGITKNKLKFWIRNEVGLDVPFHFREVTQDDDKTPTGDVLLEFSNHSDAVKVQNGLNGFLNRGRKLVTQMGIGYDMKPQITTSDLKKFALKRKSLYENIDENCLQPAKKANTEITPDVINYDFGEVSWSANSEVPLGCNFVAPNEEDMARMLLCSADFRPDNYPSSPSFDNSLPIPENDPSSPSLDNSLLSPPTDTDPASRPWRSCKKKWSSASDDDKTASRRHGKSSAPLLSPPAPTPATSDCFLQEYKKIELFNYGSEEDDSDEDVNADEFRPLVVPRVIQPYMSYEDSDEDEAPLEVECSSTAFEEPAVSAASLGPGKDFQWRQFPRSQIQPDLRKEPFLQKNGPTAQYADPYEAFIAIWDRPIMEYIARETNKYAQELAAAKMSKGIASSSGITQWVDTTAGELYTYFAIILATGIVIKSRLEEYWQTSKDIFSTPEFSVAMPYDRFCLLSTCLHFNNNDICNAENMSKNEAKLYKVLPIVQHLNEKFMSLYVLGRNIALDESLTQGTGFLSINQPVPNKVASPSIKTYEVCETLTGYLWRFEVEARQDNKFRGNPALVLRFLHGLEHKGYTVWMDSHYSSPALARQLKLLGFDCVGTLRTNRQIVPAQLADLKAKDMKAGQVCGCTSGDVDVIVWRDKKRIAFLSTYHGSTAVKCGDTIKPTLILDYNLCMGGLDRKDQMLASYPIERRQTRVWYKKFFRRLLNASVLNAYIMFKANRKINHRGFRRSLVLQLLERHKTLAPTTRQQPSVSDRHIPQFFERGTPGQVHARRRRRKCVVCAKRTVSYCEGCGGKALCVPICFSLYHP